MKMTMELEPLFDANAEFNFYLDDEFEELDIDGLDQFWSEDDEQKTLLD